MYSGRLLPLSTISSFLVFLINLLRFSFRLSSIIDDESTAFRCQKASHYMLRADALTTYAYPLGSTPRLVSMPRDSLGEHFPDFTRNLFFEAVALGDVEFVTIYYIPSSANDVHTVTSYKTYVPRTLKVKRRLSYTK